MNRFQQTLGWALLMILLVGYLWPRFESGIPAEQFWIQKAQWKQNADIVLAGDSRIYRGLSPERMQQILPKCCIKNFGFSVARFTPDYLKAIEAVLIPTSQTPVIVLGISPLSLTFGRNMINGFRDAKEKSRWEQFLWNYFGILLNWIKPITKEELAPYLSSYTIEKYYRRYEPNGWVASSLTPENPTLKLDHYRTLFRDNPVSPKLTNHLLQTVSRWKKQGIKIYAFRPPTTLLMVQLENEISGFQEKTFIRQFSEAGGTWISIEPEGWNSYDGSHLSEQAALRLSEQIAHEIEKRERFRK